MPHISTADIPFRPQLTLSSKLIKHLQAITTFAALQFNDADVDVCHCMSAPLGMQFHGKRTRIETETETALGGHQMQTRRGENYFLHFPNPPHSTSCQTNRASRCRRPQKRVKRGKKGNPKREGNEMKCWQSCWKRRWQIISYHESRFEFSFDLLFSHCMPGSLSFDFVAVAVTVSGDRDGAAAHPPVWQPDKESIEHSFFDKFTLRHTHTHL